MTPQIFPRPAYARRCGDTLTDSCLRTLPTGWRTQHRAPAWRLRSCNNHLTVAVGETNECHLPPAPINEGR